MKKLLLFIFLTSLLLASSCNTKKNKTKKAKYIFFFIGDGYGPAQAHLAEAYLAQKKGKIAPTPLFMNTFPVHGTYTTYAGNRFITGSAAAGTALAAGHKTSINTICMSHDHAEEYQSLAEQLRDKGLKIGIVTSVSIDHATPAVFYAHQPHRKNYYNIALELPQSKFNYFAGGGFKDPYGQNKSDILSNMGLEKENSTKINKNDSIPSAYTVAQLQGYRFVKTKAEFNKLKNGDDKVIVFDPKPAGGASIPYVLDQTKDNFTLVDYTKKGIELLDNPDGFFMMVEGGKIDWACHANDVVTTIHEVLQFDNAVKEAYDFYKKHPDETLIVICSDHETGGLTLGYALSHYETSLEILSKQNISSEVFTNMMEVLKSKYKKVEYKQVYPLLKKHYGLDTSEKLKLSPNDILAIKKAIIDYNTHTIDEQMSKPLLECAYGPYNPIATVAARILAHKAGIAWTTYSHTAIPCPARAIGVGADEFYGYYDNTHIPQKIMKIFEQNLTK